jgi:GDP-D-mannose 3', 5'-epimerase
MTSHVVTGAGGFIGGHLVKALLERGEHVRAVDMKPLEQWEQLHPGAGNLSGDLRDSSWANAVIPCHETVWSLAADMGGMGYIGNNEAGILASNLLISVNTISAADSGATVVYSSSACVYPEYRQNTTITVPLSEDMAYPAAPDLEYGWEKLTTERLLQACHAEGLLDVRIARFHNIYGPLGEWRGGREKAPAAMCRKAAEAPDGGEIEVWGDGQQTRSFCHVSDCVAGLLRLAGCDYSDPVNIGSDRLVTVDELAGIAIGCSGKELTIRHVPGTQGVRGRNADLTLCRKVLDWEPQVGLEEGMQDTYDWIAAQVRP